MGEPTDNATATQTADLVVLGGTVLTLDRNSRRASALAARDGRITAIGDDRTIAGLIGTEHDRGGSRRPRRHSGLRRVAQPSHLLRHDAGRPGRRGSPPNAAIGDIVERVRQAVRDRGPGEWIRGLPLRRHLARRQPPPQPARPRPGVAGQPDDPDPCDRPFLRGELGRAAGHRHHRADPGPAGRCNRQRRARRAERLAHRDGGVPRQLRNAVTGCRRPAEALLLADDEYLAHGVTSVHDTGIGLVAARVSWMPTGW